MNELRCSICRKVSNESHDGCAENYRRMLEDNWKVDEEGEGEDGDADETKGSEDEVESHDGEAEN
jgi:hypothetical protein